MTAPKNPYEFTDTILLREIRRRVDWDDERLDHLLEVVELRLWGRALELDELRSRSESEVSLQRLKRLEQEQESVKRELEDLLDMVKPLEPPSRPVLTVIGGGSDA